MTHQRFTPRWPFVVVVTLLLAFAWPGAVHTVAAATTFYVNGDPTIGSDTNNCTSASTPCLTITAAIGKAAAGDRILIAGQDKKFDGVYCEQLVIGISLTLEAQHSTNPPVIDGGGSGSSCTKETAGQSVVTVGGSSSAPVVTLAGLIIQHGDASQESLAGGGILNFGTLTVSDSTISGNVACSSGCGSGGLGGGIANGGTLTVSDSTISDNVACSGSSCNGGLGGGISNGGTLTVSDSTISDNVACSGSSCSGINVESVSVGGGGGGIASDGTVTVSDSTISDNIACSGACDGGGYGGGIANAGTVTVTNSTISGNVACSGSSGTDCLVGGGGYGGGIVTEGALTMSDSTVSDNIACSGSGCGAGLGGGIFVGTGGGLSSPSGGSTLTVTNSTISGNVACKASCSNGGEAGGIFEGDSSTLMVINSTISGNEACKASCGNDGGEAGGIDIFDMTRLSNTILAGNVASNGPDCSGTIADGTPNGTTTVGHNLLGNDDDCTGLTNGTNGDQVGTSSHPIDPKLGPLQNNGGPTPTMALLTGSPAIGQGDAATCELGTLANGAPGPNNLDQRGSPRHADTRKACDIGAYDTGGLSSQPPKPQTIQFGPLSDKTYGDPPFTVSASATSGLPVSFSASPATVCRASGTNGSTITIVGVGSCTVTASQGGNAQYAPASPVSQTFKVNPAVLTVTASSATITYGAAIPLITPHYAGFVNGDTSQSLTHAPTCGTSATSHSGVGQYRTFCTGAEDPNYTIRYVDGVLTITPAVLTIQAPDLTVQYSDLLPPLTPRYVGFVNGDTSQSLTSLPTCGTSAQVASDGEVLSGPGVYTIDCSGARDPNYTIRYTAGRLTVLPEGAQVHYTGLHQVETACPTCRSYHLLLATTVQDLPASPSDPDPGDISRATVRFVDRSSGQTLCTAGVVLVQASDLRTGTASCTLNGSIPLGQTSQQLVVGTVVGGYYQRDAASDDQQVTITLGSGTHSVAVVGTLPLTQAAGLAVVDGGSQLQLMVKVGNSAGGLLGTVKLTVVGGRSLQFTASQLDSLVVKGQHGVLSGQCTITDVRSGQVVAQQAPFVLTLQAGAGQAQVGVTVWLADGQLALSSAWDGTQTVAAELSSGFVVVH
jgi:hypothetical protein